MSSLSWMQLRDQNTPNGDERSGPVPDDQSGATRLILRCTSIVLGALMIIGAFVELGSLSGTDAVTKFFIALYIMLFGGVLILYEMQGFVMCDGVDSTMRRYFGLVYGHLGRAIFIIFIAFLNFALTDAGSLPVVTGLLLLAVGGAMILLYCKYPHLLAEEPGLADPKPPAPAPGSLYVPPPNMPLPSTDL